MINKNVYRIIPPLDPNGGLCYILQIVFQTLLNALYKFNNLIPIIDLTQYDNVYLHTPETIGKINPWEYYFKQPTDTLISIFDNNPVVKHNYSLNDKRWLFKKYIKFNDDIIKSANSFLNTYTNQYILGVRIRGTDYVNTAPAGHDIQPSIEQVINDIQTYLKTYKIDKIFVSTDESKYFKELKNKFGTLIIKYQNIFIDNTSTTEWNGTYLNKTHDMNFIIQSLKEYLVNVIVLSKCQYLITGHTCAYPIINLLRDCEPISEKLYDFGTYDKPKFKLLSSGFVDITKPIDCNKPFLILHPDCVINSFNGKDDNP